VGVASPRKSRKSDFVPQRRRSNTLNRSEVSANANFLAKLSNREIYLKMALRLGLIKSNYLSHKGCIDFLNSCKVSAENSYKVFIRKIQNDSNYLRMYVLVDS
jgi:hypothetical protein